MKFPSPWPLLSAFFALAAAITGDAEHDPDDVTLVPAATAKAVYDAAYSGCTDLEIAGRHLVSQQHIRNHYAEDLEVARANRAYMLRKAQTVTALKGNAPLLTWLGRNELGQSLNPEQPLEAEPALEARVG